MTNEEKFREVFGIDNEAIHLVSACECVYCDSVECKDCPLNYVGGDWRDKEYEEVDNSASNN